MSFWQIQNEAFFGLFILELNLFFFSQLVHTFKIHVKKDVILLPLICVLLHTSDTPFHLLPIFVSSVRAKQILLVHCQMQVV